LGPLTTELARAAHFRPEGLGGEAAHYELWSGVALGSHVVPWIVLQLLQPGTPMFWVGLAVAFAFGGVWWWVRGEIRTQFAAEIAAKEKALREAEASGKRKEEAA
jgi:PTS system galactitol-specific IIC component